MKKVWYAGVTFILLLGWTIGGRAQAAAAPAAIPATVSAVKAIVRLKSQISSGGAKPGQPVKATIFRNVTLPGGPVLVRGAELRGTIVRASKHTKELPNGVLILKFDHAEVKGQPDVPVLCRIVWAEPDGTAASVEEMTPKDRADKEKANAEAVKKTKQATGLPGVYLEQTAEGSGMFFALGQELFLDANVEFTVLLAPVPAK